MNPLFRVISLSVVQNEKKNIKIYKKKISVITVLSHVIKLGRFFFLNVEKFYQHDKKLFDKSLAKN